MTFKLAPVLLLAVLAGCATRRSMDADYERALAPWQGQTEEALRNRWGKPASEEGTGGGKWLTYVVTHPAGSGDGPRFGISIGGFGMGGGHLGGGVGVAAPLDLGGAAAASTCTTRFLVEDGKVSSWTFDGAGCGR